MPLIAQPRTRGNITLYLDMEDWEAFQLLMQRKDTSPSARIRRFIRAELRRAQNDGK